MQQFTHWPCWATKPRSAMMRDSEDVGSELPSENIARYCSGSSRSRSTRRRWYYLIVVCFNGETKANILTPSVQTSTQQWLIQHMHWLFQWRTWNIVRWRSWKEYTEWIFMLRIEIYRNWFDLWKFDAFSPSMKCNEQFALNCLMRSIEWIALQARTKCYIA